MKIRTRTALVAVTILSAMLFAPIASSPAKFRRLAAVNGGPAQVVAVARTANGTLHLIYQTFAGTTPVGLATIAISAAGHAGPQTAALSGWHAGQPGLLALPGGTLTAVFGAISPSNVPSAWGITSTNGGSSWSNPVSVLGGGPVEAGAYASDITAAMAGTTPVITLPHAGNLNIQKGLGVGSPSYQLTSTADGATTDADLGVDAATGEVVAGWESIAHNVSNYLQGAAPTVGAPQLVPGQSPTALIPAGRDTGPGVFAAYTSDNKHVRLLQYGGKTLAVGSLRGVTAKRLAVATGLGGRMWVMWGDDTGGGLAVTRSNRAVTRFEPIQHLKPNSFALARIFGDGRLGPLDLLIDQIPNVKGSIPPMAVYYARVLPELSASVSVKKIKNKSGKLTAAKLTVTVSDAGDVIQGAIVSVKGATKKTDKHGKASLHVQASAGEHLKMTITSPRYKVLLKKVKL